MLFFLLVIVVLTWFYYYWNSYQYWSKLGVKQASTWDAIKESFQLTSKKLAFREFHLRNYRRDTKQSRYIGMYQFGKPILMIRDPDLLKQITIKDRDYFLNRQTFVTPGNDPFWDANLFSLSGEKWQIMRSTLSPAFTSNKMKAMFILMNKTAEEFVEYFQGNTGSHQMKDIFRRFAANVIASCAFGLQCNTMVERNHEFYLKGVVNSKFTGIWKSVKIALNFLYSGIGKILPVNAFEPEVSKFFLEIVKDQLRIREEKKIIRPDMLHLLMEARKGNLKHEGPEDDAGFATVQESEFGKGKKVKIDFTDIEITSQVCFFFIAGFDTISTALAFTAYELAIHPDIQERLRNEINQVYQDTNGKLSYEALIAMKYMDMVISESLRKWPPAIFTDRVCSEKYTIKKSPLHSDEPDQLVIHPKTAISIPINTLHYDPEFYPDPEVFNPERFNDVNKHNIRTCTYLPFGLGPKNCIGSRFALMELKVLFFHLVREFEIVPDVKTNIPVELAKGLFNLDSSDGIILSFRRK